MIVFGLTGSIGMGKSTTAKLFAEFGVGVWDADAAVHRLYQPGGLAVGPITEAFPGTGSASAGIDRVKLSAATLGNPEALKKLEHIVHPLVREDQAAFLKTAAEEGREIVLLDIPLLVESGQAGFFEAIVVVTADPAVRRARVLAREGMTEEKLDAILARQASEEERLQHATFTVETDQGLEHAREQVRAIVAVLREKHGLPPLTELGSDKE